MKNNYYLTFGSDERFPFPNSYIIVKADTVREAQDKFKDKYPNRPGSSCLNYSFLYSEEEWKNSSNSSYYAEPSLVM